MNAYLQLFLLYSNCSCSCNSSQICQYMRLPDLRKKYYYRGNSVCYFCELWQVSSRSMSVVTSCNVTLLLSPPRNAMLLSVTRHLFRDFGMFTYVVGGVRLVPATLVTPKMTNATNFEFLRFLTATEGKYFFDFFFSPLPSEGVSLAVLPQFPVSKLFVYQIPEQIFHYVCFKALAAKI